MGLLLQQQNRGDIMKVRKHVEAVKERANVVKNMGKDTEEILHQGNVEDSVVKQKSTNNVGISLGVTKNMGDFNSLRIDVWYSDYIQPGESVEEALGRVHEVVDTALEELVQLYDEQEQ